MVGLSKIIPRRPITYSGLNGQPFARPGRQGVTATQASWLKYRPKQRGLDQADHAGWGVGR
jgi:hypothetical protein